MPSFELVRESWLPCIDLGGSYVELGLLDVLEQAHEIRSLHDPSPLTTAALHRLLLAVLHRLFGPKNLRAWYALWQLKRWPVEDLADYFEYWEERFDLFHPTRPFYQAADDRVSPKSVIHLIHSSANNPTLFSHETDEGGIAFTPAQAARSLVTAQAFHLGGLSSPRTGNFTDAPLSRGVLFLVQGETLFETLALNLLRYPDDQVLPSDEEDKPAWEMDDPFSPNRTTPFGYLDYLTWQTTRTSLFPEDGPDGVSVRQITIAPGLRLNPDLRDPMKHYWIKDKTLRLHRFNEDRALWRDYHTLFAFNVAADEEQRPPAAFNWIAELAKHRYVSREHRYRCAALGMASDQAKIFFYRHQQMPLPLEYFQEAELVSAISSAVSLADDVARWLRYSLFTFAELVILPTADQESSRRPAKEDIGRLVGHWGVSSLFWNDLEPAFWQLIDQLTTDPDAAIEDWRNALKQAARHSFEHAETLSGSTPDTLKGAVSGRRQLEAGLAKLLNPSLQEEKTE